MADIAKLPGSVRSALKERGISDEQMASMSPREMFAEYCTWHGLINWSDTLWDNVSALSALATQPVADKTEKSNDEAVPEVVIWLEDGRVRGAVAATPVHVAVIDYDTDGADDDDVIQIPQCDGAVADARASIEAAELDPARAAELLEAIEERRPAYSFGPG